MIAEAGFQKVEYENLVGGVVAIHSGLKFQRRNYKVCMQICNCGELLKDPMSSHLPIVMLIV